MPSADLKQAIRTLGPDLPADVLEAFFERMEDDYFNTFTPAAVASHLRMVSALGPEMPVQVRISPHEHGDFEIVIVGFDYLGQFSIFCGLMSAFGLDIRSGDVYSFVKRSRGSKVVDVFRVAPIHANCAADTFDETQQREFINEMQLLVRLLAGDSLLEARTRLYRFLTERIETLNEPLGGLLSPLTLRFDNNALPDRTVMEVESEDTFAFLYAVSNALSLRGIYINAVRIRSSEGRTHDQFVIADRAGRKIQEGLEQERLTLGLAMIKQFTRFVTEAPDPAKAMHHFDQFLDKLVEIGDGALYDRTLSLLSRSAGMSRLARLLGSSDDLWENFLRIHFAELIPLIEADSAPSDRATMQRKLRAALDAAPAGEQRPALNAFKDRQLFLVDVRHLLQADATPFEFSNALTDLAEVVIDEAARISHERIAERLGPPPGPFAMFALGKFGGREMGYASDLELLFVHDGDDKNEFFEAVAHQISGLIEARKHGVFHIDLRLRPHGDAGAWSTSFDQFEKYYRIDGAALPFERQALIKLRWFAGNENLGRRVETHRDSFTYGGQPWDWADALHLRERQMRELVKPGKVNVKYSAGALIDIEYAVQYLQLMNGAEHPEIRLPSTLDALESLRQLQIVRESDYHLLRSSYLFLRKLIDALRIVRGDASDLLLPDSADEYKSLARRMGFDETDRAMAAARLAADVRETMYRVHAYFTARFARSA